MSKSKYLIGCLIMIVMGVIGISDADAAYIDVDICPSEYNRNLSVYNTYAAYHSNFNSDITGEAATIFNEQATNRIVYCTAHGVPLDGGDADYVNYQTLDSDNNLLARVLAYGYLGNNERTCSVARLGTQVLVHLTGRTISEGWDGWKNWSASDFANMFAGSYRGDIGRYAYDVKEKVFTHGVVPSFSKTTSAAAVSDANRIELKYNPSAYNFSNTYTDTNGILSTFSIKSDSSYIVPTRSGNNLTITSSNDSVTNPISMSKSFPSGSTTYRRAVGNYQPTVYTSPPSNKTTMVYVGYKYETIGKGRIGIHKIDRYTSKNMQGVTFGIYSDDKCEVKAKDYLGNELSSKETDKNGLLEWNNLYYPLEKDTEKVYYVKELKMESGYTTDRSDLESLNAGENNCIPVTLKAKNQTGIESEESKDYKYIGINNYELVPIHNIPYGNVTILKQDSDTGGAVQGVEFRLLKFNKDRSPATDIDGTVVENAVTNEWGIAVFENIPYGDYILEEVKTPAGYKPLTEPIEFTLDNNTDALKYSKNEIDALPIVDTDDKFKYTLGDPSGDKKIDNIDLEILDKIVKGEMEGITISQRYASDVNSDGKVNSEDLDIMTKYINGDTALIEMKEVEVTTDDLLPPETYKLGDPTDDGVIDNNDLDLLTSILDGTVKQEEITKVQKYASDVNQNGNIDDEDKELMAKYLEGDKSLFEGLKEIAYPDQFQVRATLVITNVPIDMKISKQAITNSKEIKGAVIVIKTSDGKIFNKYKSTGKPKEFYIPAGEYTLIEEVAPKGYENLKTEVKFKVGTDGNIKLLSVKSNMYKLVKSQEEEDTDLDHLVIYNNLKKVIVPNTGSNIAFLSIVAGVLLIGGGTYVIYKRYKMS